MCIKIIIQDIAKFYAKEINYNHQKNILNFKDENNTFLANTTIFFNDLKNYISNLINSTIIVNLAAKNQEQSKNQINQTSVPQIFTSRPIDEGELGKIIANQHYSRIDGRIYNPSDKIWKNIEEAASNIVLKKTKVLMKKKVYFVQVHISYSSPCFLPYASGCIAAYLNNDPEITQVYDIPDIIMMREKTDVVINRFRDPYFVAFSCNQWTMEYNKALAKKLKERFPEVKILFGGHSVPHDTSFLEEFPFVDFLMHGEGEEVFRDLLLVLAENGELDKVNNISVFSY